MKKDARRKRKGLGRNEEKHFRCINATQARDGCYVVESKNAAVIRADANDKG